MRKLLGKAVLRLFGWSIIGARPKPDKYVLIAAPHTSNWDFIFLLAYAEAFGVRVSWLGKAEMFRFPFRRLLRRLGGIPVERRDRGNTVDQMRELFEARDQIALAVPTEGTRRYVEYWKSGFYQIARAANVTIVMSFLDYATKQGGFGAALTASGDLRRDMDTIRRFYAGKLGKRPQLTGRIRLREEDAELDDTGS